MSDYLMENDREALRLEKKTDVKSVREQALWAGIRPGMRVADIGSGSGKTTSTLFEITQPGGTAVGVDASEDRINYAADHYGKPGLEFFRRDVLKPLTGIGEFDFIWVRFFLEYFRSESFNIVQRISETLKPGGTLCLIDLDCNSLNYYGIPERLEKTITAAIRILEEKADFDPYAGRKLYSHLYRLGYTDIEIKVSSHHLFYGKIKAADHYNWMKKIEVIPKKIGFRFKEYKGGYDEFAKEFKKYFEDPARFIYTPLILCKGIKK